VTFTGAVTVVVQRFFALGHCEGGLGADLLINVAEYPST
jgi:hypothetical protein